MFRCRRVPRRKKGAVPSTLAMTAYFTPVIAMGMGVAFLSEGVTGLQWLGTAFIVASAVIETGRQDK